MLCRQLEHVMARRHDKCVASVIDFRWENRLPVHEEVQDIPCLVGEGRPIIAECRCALPEMALYERHPRGLNDPARAGCSIEQKLAILNRSLCKILHHGCAVDQEPGGNEVIPNSEA
ncbi:MAG: hypothetical protein QOG25_1765, partial [Acetobacteraceae bacterium]|nr:hypothetical protein [Acetobacteraceae bacterium]